MGIAGMGTFRPELIMKSLIPGKWKEQIKKEICVILEFL